MKILLTADLHSRREWYRWLLDHARDSDLVCIAGDLMDMFLRLEAQASFLREQWLPAFIATGVPLAITTGNHDWQIGIWMSSAMPPGVVGAGRTELVKTRTDGKIVVTTCPYDSIFSELDPLMHGIWKEGAALREKWRVPWLVLAHEPPPQLAPALVVNRLSAYIERYSPDYVSAGHFHEGPRVLGKFAERTGATWCFNAGQQGKGRVPDHIVLEPEVTRATWVRTTPSNPRVPMHQSESRVIIHLG